MRILLVLVTFFQFLYSSPYNSPSFLINEKTRTFELDGRPFQYISGSIHYFRIVREQWADRLQKARALGLNAIQYYIPWNLHRPEESQSSDFSGALDFAEFSLKAHDLGLWTILRIGPYICGEWENGGLPAWLLNKNISKLRTSDAVYLEHVGKWFDDLLPRVKPLLRKNGGPVLMLQIENEYGSYDGCDKAYLRFLRDYTRSQLGDDVVLFTTDGNSESMLECGSVENVLATVDFGPSGNATQIEANFELQRKFAPNGPMVNSEYYPGWLVLWGQRSQTLPPIDAIVGDANTMHSMGANFNFYMIHGGTNWGFWNGAEPSAPCITSYDYGAPISEAGDVTRNYLEIRKWIKTIEDWPTRPLDVPTNSRKRAFGRVGVHRVHSNGGAGDCVDSDKPISFETLGHFMGLVAYRTTIQKCGTLEIPKFADFVYVYVNGKYQGKLSNHYYNTSDHSLTITGCSSSNNSQLFLLVENQGRQTYETISDPKGILSEVTINKQVIHGWTQCGIQLPLQLGSLPEMNQQQGVFLGTLNVGQPADTWLDTRGWGKGLAIVNGHNIGRYWPTQGPQMTLYVPAEFLKTGENSVMIVELEGAGKACTKDGACQVEFLDHPIFDFPDGVFKKIKDQTHRNL